MNVSAERAAGFPEVSPEERKIFARITGHTNLHDLSMENLCILNREIAEYTACINKK